MTFHTFLKVKSAKSEIDLTVAAIAMGVNYKTLYTRIMSGKVSIEELLQLSDIYDFTLGDMKEDIKYNKIIL